MTSVSDAFGLPFRDSQWFSKTAIQGLITIIPIVGWISLAGWVLLTLDNYKAGRYELASPGFHLERGLPLFGVLFVYGLVIGIVGAIFKNISMPLGSLVQIV